MCRELRGEQWGILRHQVDASACKAILMRKGAGSIKHLETKDLWVQEAIRRKGIVVVKVDRKLNLADSLASYSPASVMRAHMEMLRGAAYSLAGLGA